MGLSKNQEEYDYADLDTNKSDSFSQTEGWWPIVGSGGNYECFTNDVIINIVPVAKSHE